MEIPLRCAGCLWRQLFIGIITRGEFMEIDVSELNKHVLHVEWSHRVDGADDSSYDRDEYD